MAKRWNEPAGYGEVWRLALPMTLSSMFWSLQHFINRIFLTWDSKEAIAACMPAGMTHFTILCFFIGAVSYVNTFVAQYTGAGREHRVGASVWQGFYLALLTGIPCIGAVFLARPIFALAGHEPAVQAMEVEYFSILCYGAFGAIACPAFSSFFTGRGDTVTALKVDLAGTLVNVFLDYVMIFGRFGFPAMGIRGAGWASVISIYFTMTLFVILMLRKKHRDRYHVLKAWRFDKQLFFRMLRFGAPSGLTIFTDLVTWTTFVMFIGRFGVTAQAATNIAFNINALAFMPMFGFGMAISTLVGQYLGKDRPDLAERSTHNGARMAFFYIVPIALTYMFTPRLFLFPFTMGAHTALTPEVERMVTVLLRFVAAYCIVDTGNIIYSCALKGAGDSRYVMIGTLIPAILILLLPIYIVCGVFGYGLYVAWTIATIYLWSLVFVFWIRFKRGKWKSMRVIEEAPPDLIP